MIAGVSSNMYTKALQRIVRDNKKPENSLDS